MKKSVKAIASIAIAAMMATGTAAVTASAMSYKEAYTQSYSYNYNFIDVDENNITMFEGEAEYVTVTAEGSHSIKAISYDPAVANVKFASKKFHGDDIDIRITAKRAGITTVRVYFTKDKNNYADITVNVKSIEPEKSNVYSYNFTYYSFTTGFYYRNYNDAVKASGDSATIYNGRVQTSSYGSENFPYFSAYTYQYYPDYNMAVAASRGNANFVSKIELETKSRTYTRECRYYSFTTNYYYSSYNAALKASDYDSTVIYNGEVVASYYYSNSNPYYSAYTDCYYQSYAMALAASRGCDSLVSYISSDYDWSL